MKNTRSLNILRQAEILMPGGVNSPVRAFKSVGLSPLIIKKAHESKIYDVDENEYIDYVMSYGPMLLGHGDARVIKAISDTAKNGFGFGATTETEVELAGLVNKYFPSMEMIRLVNSGTEAVMSAIRLARGFTKRDKIIKFEGCYHGHSDSMLVKAGSGALTTSIPSSAGIPVNSSLDTLVAVYNDLETVKDLFLNHKREVAAVIIEPVAANMGVVLPKDGFLEGLMDLCHENDSLIIFDEVITGFRVSHSGAQGLFGLKPDITCLGKIIGGGLPIGAFGGRRDIMEYLSPIGPVYQAGTLSGNPICVAAGIATIKAIEEDDAVSKANEASQYLIKNLKDEIKGFDDKITMNGIASLLTIFFKGRDVNNFRDVMKSDAILFKKFFGIMLNEGIFIAPSQYEAMFLSSKHSKHDIDKTVLAIKKAIKEVLC
ncbi:glutamate-1-semialdehyde 2,1-aminomutase [Candidatus Acidulodesulfobacterium sp. H_13]|uniref:glutamate-1-semialdehyde 2,1-aminomutase n=1 Tax=Candidatus Acidulodesulfobacterium sp. H_13 TaxID=3395470 RepID=UPI003AF99D8E